MPTDEPPPFLTIENSLVKIFTGKAGLFFYRLLI